MALAELRRGMPCVPHGDIYDPEIRRVETVLRGVFNDIPPERVLILEEVLQQVDHVCSGVGTVEDFIRYQEGVLEDPRYRWLQEHHPTVTGPWWRIMLALTNPKKYGKDLYKKHPMATTVGR